MSDQSPVSSTQVVATDDVAEIAGTLTGGGLVALPTETVYGLAARAEDPDAVAAVFEAKGRPQDNPLIVHCSDAEQAFSLVTDIPDWAGRLAETFWPGPLTMVFHSAVEWPWVQAGHTTLAVRVPEPEYLRSVIRQAGPLAAPSANRSGAPSPTTPAHVLADLGGVIPMLVDGGPCDRGLESTVVDCTGIAPIVLRPGPVTTSDLVAALAGTAAGEHGRTGVGVSPGTRHQHYRPRARVMLVETLEGAELSGRTMVLGPAWGTEGIAFPDGVEVRTWTTVEEAARMLYAWLREADDLGLDRVIVVPPPEKGMGVAVMNRLRKAAAED